ncbi:MAG: hypothetical protein ACOC1F_08420, partial [Myxococcota bacterium]
MASLGGELKVEVSYVPGNHDRLVALFPAARKAARDILGLGDASSPFPARLHCSKHGVLAVHGHEFDAYNHERPDAQNPDGVPIGDPITTELVARIPKTVAAAIHDGVPGVAPETASRIERNFESLEDVRPMSAIVEWLLSHVRNEPELEEAVHRGLDAAVSVFTSLPFVQHWFDKHDSWMSWDDDADRLQWLLWVAGNVPLHTAGKLAPSVMKLRKLAQGPDPFVAAARDMFDGVDLDTHFVVMGHTHHAKREAVQVIPRPGRPPIRRVYLNTGTWRPCHYRCSDGSGFLAWKEMTFTMIYAPEERRDRGMPSFETWSGTLDAGESSRYESPPAA